MLVLLSLLSPLRICLIDVIVNFSISRSLVGSLKALILPESSKRKCLFRTLSLCRGIAGPQLIPFGLQVNVRSGDSCENASDQKVLIIFKHIVKAPCSRISYM